jgi:hypothetical protein
MIEAGGIVVGKYLGILFNLMGVLLQLYKEEVYCRDDFP